MDLPKVAVLTEVDNDIIDPVRQQRIKEMDVIHDEIIEESNKQQLEAQKQYEEALAKRTESVESLEVIIYKCLSESYPVTEIHDVYSTVYNNLEYAKNKYYGAQPIFATSPNIVAVGKTPEEALNNYKNKILEGVLDYSDKCSIMEITELLYMAHSVLSEKKIKEEQYPPCILSLGVTDKLNCGKMNLKKRANNYPSIKFFELFGDKLRKSLSTLFPEYDEWCGLLINLDFGKNKFKYKCEYDHSEKTIVSIFDLMTVNNDCTELAGVDESLFEWYYGHVSSDIPSVESTVSAISFKNCLTCIENDDILTAQYTFVRRCATENGEFEYKERKLKLQMLFQYRDMPPKLGIYIESTEKSIT